MAARNPKASSSPDVSKMETEAESLAEQIRYHNEKYWVEHKQEISDPEYDQLVERLRVLDPQNAVLVELVEDAGDAANFPKVKHDAPMLSIEKVFEAADVVKWGTDCGSFPGDAPEDGITAAYKVDGISCSLIYEDGKLVRAATRGNGVLGDDITRNAKTISDIPQKVPDLKARTEVRGEIYMSTASFKEVVARFEADLAAGEATEDDRPTNPRNYCAGSIKQKDPKITKARKLSFMAHGCVGRVGSCEGKSEGANQAHLKSLGFDTAFFRHIKTPEEVADAIASIEAQRASLPYEIDGVVFTVNRLSLHAELGHTSHHPRYRLAFKFGRDRGETTVVGIEWETSRSGRVCPTMIVEPIMLGGATVTRCTLHNAKTVSGAGLVAGDKVLLEREVIPYFVQRMTEPTITDGSNLPKRCPSCDSELAWDETTTNLVCKNLGGCPSQLQDFLAYYVSRGVVNMTGIGERLISKLIEKKLLKNPADFYTLTEKQILDNVERQGETSAKNIIASIASRKEQTAETFLVGLGVKGFGPSVAARLIGHFHTLDAVLAATAEEMLAVEGVAETLAATITTGLAERKDLVAELRKHITVTQAEKVEGPLTGKSFCLTGSVAFDFEGKTYDNRPDIEDMIKSKGGAIKSVSKNLNYLVVGDDAGSKLEKAKKLGITILDAAGLVNLIEGKSV